MSEYHEVLYLSDAGQWFLVDQRSGNAAILNEGEGWQRAKAMELWLLDHKKEEWGYEPEQGKAVSRSR